MQKAFLVISAIYSLMSLSACSVVMALQGQEEPDTSVLEVGTTRGNIELQIGEPASTRPNDEGGETATYEYVVGDEPSPMRALLHGGMDVLTLAIWEVVGTPIEMVQGEKRAIEIDYDPNDYVLAIRRIKVEEKDSEAEEEK